MAKKTIKARLDDLESHRGGLPSIAIYQNLDNQELYYLDGKPEDLMTEAEILEKVGDVYTPIFITYVRNWRADD